MDTATKLNEAIKHNRFLVARELVEEQQCANIVDENGRSPLHVAVLENQARIVCLLFKNGAEVDNPNRMGRTPLHEAADRGYLEIVTILLKLNSGAAADARTYHQWTALILAAGRGHTTVIKKLLEAGADIDLQTSENTPVNGRLGMTALHAAATVPEPEVGLSAAHLLLRCGVDPNATMKNGETASA